MRISLRTIPAESSSIGMAKAALEAMNGFNLYGDKGANWSVVYVDVVSRHSWRIPSISLSPRMHTIEIEPHSIHSYLENRHQK